MNEKINEALKKVQDALGPYKESHFEDIFKNITIYVTDSQNNRDIVFNVVVDDEIRQLKINNKGAKISSLPLGYTFIVDEDKTLRLLNNLAEKISDDNYGKEIELPYFLIEEIFVCEKSPKLYSEIEISKQINIAVGKAIQEANKEFDAHLNKVIAEIYTDIYYGKERQRDENRLSYLKRNVVPMTADHIIDKNT